MIRFKAGLEGALLLITVIPSILLIAYAQDAIGLDIPALPALGIFISVAIASILIWTSGSSWRALGCRGFSRPARDLALMFGAIVLAFSVYTAIADALVRLGVQPLDLSLLANAIEGNFLVYLQFMLLVVWGSAAIGEEMFARGFLLNRFEKVFQGAPLAFFFAALTQAVLFGALHFYQGPIGIAASTTTGFVLAYLYLLTGRNLIAPILAHGLIDSYAITMLFLGYNPVPSFFG